MVTVIFDGVGYSSKYDLANQLTKELMRGVDVSALESDEWLAANAIVERDYAARPRVYERMTYSDWSGEEYPYADDVFRNLLADVVSERIWDIRNGIAV